MWPFSRKKKEPVVEPPPPDTRSPLEKLQHEFFAMVTTPVPPANAEQLVSGGALTPAARVDVYASMFRARTHDALKDDFPHTAALLGEAFPRLVEQYVVAHPSQHHSLARLGHAFAPFLKTVPELRADLADLAALEWARSEAFVAIDVEPLSSDAPAQVGPGFGTAWLQLVPSVTLVSTAFDVLPVWTAMEEKQPPPDPVASPSAYLVWRKGFEVFHVAIEADEARAIEALKARAEVSTICECFAEREDPAAAAFQAIGSWFNEGMVGAIRERPLADSFGL